MPREKENFRPQLEQLYERFGREREAISIKEACLILNVHHDTLIRNKEFPKIKLGKIWVVPIVALARWLAV